MIIKPVFFSTLVIGIVNGMSMLLIPLIASEKGISLIGIGGLLAIRSLGNLLINIPAGVTINRFGQKRTHAGGMCIMALACVAIPFTDSLISLAIAVLIFSTGLGSATLARHSFIAESTESNKLASKIASFAGTQRIGMLIGPVLAGVLGQWFSYSVAFLFCTPLLILAIVYFAYCFEESSSKTPPVKLITQFKNLPGFIIDHKHIFLTAGLFVVVARMVRSVRQFILPLWGIYIALDPADIGLILSISMAVEIVFLYVGGKISDSRGRKWSAIPSFLLFCVGLILLPLSQSFYPFAAIALVLGVGHGLGGGIIMTLGADLAPKDNVSTFLGSWRLIGDLSGTMSPLLIGWIGSVFMLATASIFGGIMAAVGCLVFHYWVKETLANPKQEI